MAATLSLTYSRLPGGGKIAYGTATLSNVYLTGGETMDVSSEFAGSPIVLSGGDDGYVVRHDRGNASAGKLIAYAANGGAAAAAALVQVANATDLSAAICHVVIVGAPALS